jgi:hypothetical protein
MGRNIYSTLENPWNFRVITLGLPVVTPPSLRQIHARYTLSTQFLVCLVSMAEMKIFHVRIGPSQRRQLERLSKKLGVDAWNVIRIAIAKLAEAEGINRECFRDRWPNARTLVQIPYKFPICTSRRNANDFFGGDFCKFVR